MKFRKKEIEQYDKMKEEKHPTPNIESEPLTIKSLGEFVTYLRKHSAGWGFVTGESIIKFEEQFVIPAVQTFFSHILKQAQSRDVWGNEVESDIKI